MAEQTMPVDVLLATPKVQVSVHLAAMAAASKRLRLGVEGPLVADALDKAATAFTELVEVHKEVAGMLRTIQLDHKDRWSNERTNMVSAWLLASDKALAAVRGGA